MMKTVTKDTTLKLMFGIPKYNTSYTVICHSYQKECKLKKWEKSVCDFYKKNYVAQIKALKQTLNHGLKLKKNKKTRSNQVQSGTLLEAIH